MASRSSVRPAPTSPASPTISPARTSNDTGFAFRCTPTSPSTRSRTAAPGFAARGSAAAMSRPTISRSSIARSNSPRFRSPVGRPSRSTSTRSAMRSTSSRWCETKTTAVPCARSSPMMPSSRSASRALRLDVGSSSTSTRASQLSALAISTSCRCAIGSAPQGVDGSSSSPTCRSQPRARSRMAWRSMNPRRAGSRPRKMDPATSRFSGRFSSWCTSAMPARAASRTPASFNGYSTPSAPATSSDPSLGCTTPERILRSVLFPAPFSPTIASTSPPRTSRLMPASAVTPA